MSMYRIVTDFSGPTGAPWQNVLYFDTAAGSASQAAGAVDAFWVALKPVMQTTVDFVRISEVAQISEVTGTLELLSSVGSVSGSGTNAAELAPTVLQALIRWRTAVTFDGRILQGRSNIPGLTVNSLDSGLLIAADRTTIEGAANGLRTALNTRLVVWHRPIIADPTHVPPIAARPGAFATVGVSIVPSKLAVLRTRRD